MNFDLVYSLCNIIACLMASLYVGSCSPVKLAGSPMNFSKWGEVNEEISVLVLGILMSIQLIQIPNDIENGTPSDHIKP